MTGRVSYLAGMAAEDSVVLGYEREGYETVARRWRGSGGEIDLVLRDRDGFVFVEVKKTRDLARAAQRLSQAQLARICQSACEFLGSVPGGMLMDMRFDLAMVDATGRMARYRNITM
ncbi:MAG: YraN family protein [Maritimibacter sp.]|uniref:YraN family protein n=1 Tax=Maritimibacter sp. TaxID=2003363 RepID=UPI001D636B65|nr:YraN family protein [Maritimibacter sp.]MBL6428625.1 YraN family protein [Maritimibacter sp.]